MFFIDAVIPVLLDPYTLLLLVLGTLLGLVFGILPGLGGATALALLIPLTFVMDPLLAFMVLAAAKGGTNFGGSVTAILLNTPGQAPSAATLLDGYPMTRQGRSGEALGASAAASALGAIFGLLVLTISIPIVLEILRLFASPETFWLGVWGISVVALVVRGSVMAGLISAVIGILIAQHGLHTITVSYRWTYGLYFLNDGIPLVPAIIGIFAVAEMIRLVSRGQTISNVEIESSSGKWKGVKAVYEHKYVFFQSSIIGVIIGTIPAVGGTAANFIAYFQAAQSDPDSFGTGDVRGVIASEASNDAKDGGALIPTLGFGIPGSATMAILLGAFILHGITPGPLLFQQNFEIVVAIIAALLLSNILTSSIGILFADKLAIITRLDIRYIAGIVLALAFFGGFAIRNNQFDMLIVTAFGILGFVMIKIDMSRVPLILGMILTPIIENNFFRSLATSRGAGYAVFWQSTVSKILIVLIIVSLSIPYLREKVNVMEMIQQ